MTLKVYTFVFLYGINSEFLKHAKILLGRNKVICSLKHENFITLGYLALVNLVEEEY